MTTTPAPPWLADVSTAQRVLLAWEVFLALLDAYGDRLATEGVDLDLDPDEPLAELTPDRLLRSTGKGRDRLLASFKQQVRRQARTERLTELDIACDFLVGGSPARITVSVKRRGRKASWDPRTEALFTTTIWKLMGDPAALGLPAFQAGADLRPLRRKAVERYRAEHAPGQSVANLLDRFREALPRNPYLQALLELADELHFGSWLDAHEALCVVGGWFHDRVARDLSDAPPSDIGDVFRAFSTELAGFAVKRPPMPLGDLLACAGLDARGEPQPIRGAFHDLLTPDAEGGEE